MDSEISGHSNSEEVSMYRGREAMEITLKVKVSPSLPSRRERLCSACEFTAFRL